MQRSHHFALFLVCLLSPLDAHFTSTDPRPEGSSVPLRSSLEGRRHWTSELRVVIDGGKPKAQLIGEVVTSATGAVALDERGRSEVLQARAWAGERLTSPLSSCRSVLQDNCGMDRIDDVKYHSEFSDFSYHCKAVANPQVFPVAWTLRDVHVLTVNGYDIGLGLAYHASETHTLINLMS